MGWRWLTRGLAVLLTAAGAISTVNGYLPGQLALLVSTAILAGMLVWSARNRELPEAHSNGFRATARLFVDDIDRLNEMRFAGDVDRNAEARASFRTHFWRT